MSNSTRRRRFLQAAGIGGAVMLAGCSALDGDDDNGDDNGARGDREVAVSPSLTDELTEEFEAELAALNEDVEAGDIDEEEAFQMQQQIQAEYQGKAYDALVDSLEEGSLTIEEEYENMGVVAVSGDPADLFDLLAEEGTEALIDTAIVEEQQGAQPAP